MNKTIIKYESIRPGASLTLAYVEDSGYDLSANLGVKSICLKPGSWQIINTGIKINLPNGYEGQIRSRSGLAAKHGIIVMNSPGTIDSRYTGEIKVILMNLSTKNYYVKDGEKIAQLCFSKLDPITVTDIDGNSVNPMYQERKNNGFGSSG